jgi:hypothetical protein
MSLLIRPTLLIDKKRKDKEQETLEEIVFY